MRLCLLLLLSSLAWARPLDLTGRARDFQAVRNWNSYYWREDFSFWLDPDGGGPALQIVSREPTPAYHWRMGTTYPKGSTVDWSSRPRVRVVAVTGLDRDPAEFYGQKLSPQVATALVLWVNDQPFYVNNWFHSWGADTNAAVAKIYANRSTPFDIYGFVKGAPLAFSPEAQTLLRQYPSARFYHGLVRGQPGRYQIELTHLIEQDQQGEGKIIWGPAEGIPRLDERKH